MPQAERRTLRIIAAFEALKGAAALAALAGVLDLMHHDVRHLAVALIGRFGLEAEGRFPTLLMHYADMLGGADARTILALGMGYIALRLVESYGLWFDRSWGELFGALSGALYLPFEVRHLLLRPGAIGAAVFAVNLFLIAYLLMTLRAKRRRASTQGAAPA